MIAEGRLEVDDDRLDNEEGKLKGPSAWFGLGECEDGMLLIEIGRLEMDGGRVGGRVGIDGGMVDTAEEGSSGAGFGATFVMVIDL